MTLRPPDVGARRAPLAPRAVARRRRVAERLLEVEIVDRSLVVGAQAFGALIPLLIVLASLGASDGRSFADVLIERFGLSGPGAGAVRTAFAADASSSSFTVIGTVLVIFSGLSFSRTLQRVFELTWGLPRRGMRGTLAGLRWLGLVVAYAVLHPLLTGAVEGTLAVGASLAGAFVLWLLTPWLLLDHRVAWRRLVPQAALCAVGMTALGAACAVYVPRAVSSSSAEFGGIGVAFTLLSVLWAGGFVIVGGAALGSLGSTATVDRAE